MAERRWLFFRNESASYGGIQGVPSPKEGEELMPVSEHETLRSKIKAEVERLREEASRRRQHTDPNPDSYRSAADRGQARGKETAADRLEALLNPTEGEK